MDLCILQILGLIGALCLAQVFFDDDDRCKFQTHSLSHISIFHKQLKTYKFSFILTYFLQQNQPKNRELSRSHSHSLSLFLSVVPGVSLFPHVF